MKIRDKGTALEIWDALQNDFQKKSCMIPVDLRRCLQQEHCTEKGDLWTHFAKLRTMREDLTAGVSEKHPKGMIMLPFPLRKAVGERARAERRAIAITVASLATIKMTVGKRAVAKKARSQNSGAGYTMKRRKAVAKMARISQRKRTPLRTPRLRKMRHGWPYSSMTQQPMAIPFRILVTQPIQPL
jgi:hypothetical protein